MAKITYFMARSDDGQDLHDRYVAPLCARLGARLLVAPPDADRGHALKAEVGSDFLIWDCTVGAGHVYHALTEVAKKSKKNLFVSRTPLPRNVLARHQCAPLHGGTMSNEELAEWLAALLPALLKGGGTVPAGDRSAALQRHYWMGEDPAHAFLSFRGSHRAPAAEWKQRLEGETLQTVRMVPNGEYAYGTECVTRQQMWEVIARIRLEMRACRTRVVFWSGDYLDSFWTASELLCILRDWPRNLDGSVQGAFRVVDGGKAPLAPLRVGTAELPVPEPTRAQRRWLWKIMNNTSPETAAPETQVPPAGLARLLALVLKPTMGYYDPRFTNERFWKDVQVPCPYCRPDRRQPAEVDWDRHMDLAPRGGCDYFGYFPASAEQLSSGTVRCPDCGRQLTLKNERPPRTVWVPILTTERDKSRPVIHENPVWEVEA